MGRSAIVIGLVLFLSSCANYSTRKSCEKINWFNHGQDVALRGQRLNEDETLKKCVDAEAKVDHSQMDLGFKAGRDKYCTADGAFQTGKRGQHLNDTLCDGSQKKKLQAPYQQGLKHYCSPENAVHIGSQGEVYTGVCPASMESEFRKSYLQGRKKYLYAQIRANSNSLRDVEYELVRAESKESNLSFQIGVLEQQHQANNQILANKGEAAMPEPEQLTRLRRDLSLAKNQTSKLRKDRTALKNNVQQLQAELDSLQ